jgi:dienelactone hydrolase
VIQLYRNYSANSRAKGALTLISVAFNGCFGWFHGPSDGRQREVAVLICQGVMREASLAYCSVRRLGLDLAAAGYPTLRFDYPAAGNSLDANLNESGLHWTAWQHSIDSAIDWLRGVSGAKRIVLCGFATGGALAAQVAATRSDVAGLLLFEPVVVGRNHVRQLILEGDLQRGESMPREQGLEIRENRFSAFTLGQIGELDLREVVLLPDIKAAIFARRDSKPADDCARAWSGRGIAVSRLGFDGMEMLLEQDLLDEIPLADFSAAIAWLEKAVPPAPPAAAAISLPVAVLQPPGCLDTPLRFGPEHRLFGMLCRPERGSPSDIVLIPNGGREPSFGAARQNVVLARRLAEAGIASFRFDFSGLGDSAGPPGKERVFSHAFTDRTDDIRAALDTLATLGFTRFAIHGLCLGAYHALQAAVVEPRLQSLMLINLPLFTVPASNALGQLEQRGRTAGHYLAKLLRPQSWANLLKGRSNLAALRRAAAFHLRARTIGMAGRLARRFGVMPAQSFAHRAMATLSHRGARTLYLFSTAPQDIESFAAEFGADGAGLDAYPGAEMRLVPGMDHSLTITAGRIPAETMMVEFVSAGWPEKAGR